jgi:hypothetical protein
MYESALAEKQISQSDYRKASPLPPRWRFTFKWTTVTLFISTWKWLWQLIIKDKIFIIPSWWNVFSVPKCLNTLH